MIYAIVSDYTAKAYSPLFNDTGRCIFKLYYQSIDSDGFLNISSDVNHIIISQGYCSEIVAYSGYSLL